MKAIGIAGTAKNSGKTTTLSAILEELSLRTPKIGLTSIGYDGERVDNVTGLPKPRLTMLPGQWVATTEFCLKNSSAGIKVVEKTDIVTPLGKLLIGQVERRGSIVLAGPNKSGELEYILQRMRKHQIELALVDGALNRLAPMAVTDGFILATGASRLLNTDFLARETAVIERICNSSDEIRFSAAKVTVISRSGDTVNFPFSSLLDDAQVTALASAVNNRTAQIIVPGIIGEKQLSLLAEKIPNWQGINLLVANPLKLIVSADLNKTNEFLSTVGATGGRLMAGRRVPLLAVTVNPFYPRYRYNNSDYEPAYVNAGRLFRSIKKAVRVPVVNVKQHGARKLVNILF